MSPGDGARWAGLGADLTFTTRDGGCSDGPYRSLNLAFHVGDDPAAVAENRRRAAAAFGARLEDLVFAEQVHGATAAVVGAADRGAGARSPAGAVVGADALVTTEPGLVLAIMVADCLPVALLDPEAGVLAAVHAGWRGTAADIVGETVRAMRRLGAEAGRLVAVLGPCIGADRYQVGPEVAEAVGALPGDAGRNSLVPDGPGHWRLDLAAANAALLAHHGVDPDRIALPEAATGPPGPYFSDRAARPCGRFALLTARRP